jgi:hypothetical protein
MRAIASSASSESGARPRLVWTMTPVALTAGRSVGRPLRRGGAGAGEEVALGGQEAPARTRARASSRAWRSASSTSARPSRSTQRRTSAASSRRSILGCFRSSLEEGS